MTYTAGQFAQVRLVDGTRLFLQLRPDGLTVRRMAFAGLLPGRLLWRYGSPYPLRRVGPGSPLGSKLLEALLAAVEPCATLEQLPFALETLSAVLDRLLLHGQLPPADYAEVVKAYGALFEDCAQGPTRGLLRPQSLLPFPKEAIREALEYALALPCDAQMRAALLGGLESLDDFVPDQEVPADLTENILRWAELRAARPPGNST
jgi:hypothetical protein